MYHLALELQLRLSSAQAVAPLAFAFGLAPYTRLKIGGGCFSLTWNRGGGIRRETLRRRRVDGPYRGNRPGRGFLL